MNTMTNQYRQKPIGVKTSTPLDFKLVNDPLEKIYQLTKSKLDKEPQEPPTLYFVVNLLSTSYQTYRVIRKLVADVEKEKFPVQAHMLSRSTIDAMFNVMALLDDPTNTRKYEKAGLRLLMEEYTKECELYKNDSDVAVYMAEKKALISHLVQLFNLTTQEIDKPNTIPYWPISGQFFRNKDVVLSKTRLDFLQKIYQEQYGSPSRINHLDWQGMAMAIFASKPEEHWDPRKYESDAVYTGMLSLLIMLSEIEICKEYGHKANLQYVWTILGEYYLEVKDYYQIRYRELLKT